MSTTGIAPDPPPVTPGPGPVALSIVLNVHDETKYLARTLRSCAEAARYARAGGARSEIIVVLDRPAAGTAAFIAGYDFGAFDGHQTILADHGSLGPARNTGIARATGRYITTCDADDLISFNAFDEMLAHARGAGDDAILVPQYLVMFGADHCTVEYFESELITPLMFAGYHPYHSRLFAHRRLFEQLAYTAAHPGSGYVYEDWHFNCEALARGYRFAPVAETILFCRRRRRSLLTASDQTAAPQIPPSALFAPRRYLALAAPAMEAYRREAHSSFGHLPPQAVRRGGAASLFADPVIRELTAAANAIDPAIDFSLLETAPFWMNLTNRLTPGAAYYQLCALAGTTPFTDVVLLPPEVRPSQYGYVSAVLAALQAEAPHSRALILSWNRPGTCPPGSAVAQGAPPRIIHADLLALEPDLREQEIETVIVKALQSLAPGARVHVVPGSTTIPFVTKCLGLLAPWRLIAYRFPEPARQWGTRRLNAGGVFEFISNGIEGFAAILGPEEATLRADQARLAVAPGRWHAVPPPGSGAPARRDAPTGRIICLPRHEAVAAAPWSAAAPDGGAAPPFTITTLPDWPALEQLDLASCDALLCLEWDGLAAYWARHALSHGLPVIAPRNGQSLSLFPPALHELLFVPPPEDGAAGSSALSCAAIMRGLHAIPGRLQSLRDAAAAFDQNQCSATAFRHHIRAILDNPHP